MADMDAPLIAMLVAIGIFLVLTIVGLITLLKQARALVRTAEALQEKVNSELNSLMTKQEEAMERLSTVEAQSAELSVAAARLGTEFGRLGTLMSELSKAQETLRNPFSALLHL